MANLVSGAAYHGRKTLPPLIPSRTIPDIHQDAIILGVCGVQATQQSLEVDGDGWFMSDFFAFNYLLKDQGLQQVWIAADSEHSFLDFFKDHPQHEPGFLHGNPCNERKVVFSKGLVEQGSLTPLTVHAPGNICEAFIDALRSASQLAQESAPPRPIVVFVFGHGTPDLGVYLDYSKPFQDDTASIRFDTINSAVADDVPTTIVTAACVAGGWTIQPQNNRTMLTAAGAYTEGDKEDKHLSLSWPVSESIGRAGGSIFSTTLIQCLTTISSPLLEENANLLLDETSTTKIQPSQPTDIQTSTYNSFCKAVLSTLQEEVTRRPHDHEFRFSAQDDEWAKCWMARTGIPLTVFEARWAHLPTYTSTMAESFANLDPKSPYKGRSSGNQPTLGTPNFTGGIIPRRESQPFVGQAYRSLQMIAYTLSHSCPGDWNNGVSFRVRGFLTRFADGKCSSEQEEEQAIETTLCRYGITTFVTSVVSAYGLIQAQDKTLLFWDRDIFNAYQGPTEDVRWQQITDALCKHRLFLRDNNLAFQRARLYLTDCIHQSSLTVAEAIDLVEQISQVYYKAQGVTRDKIVKSHSVRQHAKNWFETVGKSLGAISPRKTG